MDGCSEIKPEHVKKFLRLAKGLDTLMKQIWEYHPEANIYLQEDSLILMKGPTHDDAEDPLFENVVAQQWVRGSGGGGW